MRIREEEWGAERRRGGWGSMERKTKGDSRLEQG